MSCTWCEDGSCEACRLVREVRATPRPLTMQEHVTISKAWNIPESALTPEAAAAFARGTA